MFLTHIANGVATLTLNHPPVNAISEEWLRLFDAKLDELIARAHCKVLHIRSDQKVFCAGADLKEVHARMQVADGPDRTYAYVANIQRLYFRIEQLPLVTLAEIGGAAMGGGFELALSCDLRVAANEAKLGLPEVRLGLIPGAGGTQRLTRLCGRTTASRLILGAEVLDGVTACQLGLAQWSFPRAELQQRAAEIAQRIAALPGAALAASKACIIVASDPRRDGYTVELDATRELLSNAETRQRVQEFLVGAGSNAEPTKKD